MASPGSAPPDLKLRGGGAHELQVLKMAAAHAGLGVAGVAAAARGLGYEFKINKRGDGWGREARGPSVAGGEPGAEPASHPGLPPSLRPGSGPPQETLLRRGAARCTPAPHGRGRGWEPPASCPHLARPAAAPEEGGPPWRASPPCVLDANRSPIGPCITPLFSRILNIFFLCPGSFACPCGAVLPLGSYMVVTLRSAAGPAVVYLLN